MAKKDNALLKWPVIAVACLLVWPVGAVLVAMKFLELNKQYAGKELLPEGVVPFKDKKTTAQIKIYRGHINSQKRKMNTAMATLVIGLLIGSAGITATLLQVLQEGYRQEMLPYLGCFALFTLAGIMQGTTAFNMLKERKTLAMMAALIDDERVVTEAALMEGSGLPREEVRAALQTMFDRCYFADGVHADEAAGTFVCYGK